MPGRLPWIMLFFVRQLMLLRVCLLASLLVALKLGFTCQAVKGFPTLAPCLEHICAGGGSVANMGFVSLYQRGL